MKYLMTVCERTPTTDGSDIHSFHREFESLEKVGEWLGDYEINFGIPASITITPIGTVFLDRVGEIEVSSVQAAQNQGKEDRTGSEAVDVSELGDESVDSHAEKPSGKPVNRNLTREEKERIDRTVYEEFYPGSLGNPTEMK